MARYIDADKLEELCDIMAEKCDGIGESIWEQFRTTVECSPTLDVVEVVRCLDCKNLSEDRIAPEWNRICRKYGVGKSDYGFCDEVERKETEDATD